ncbi:hypothetical protein MOQ_004819 [Trypanosoma cruzi marinkellei]|uniref:Uncharacterized protein n=1 Tax=Trypanosoma cruzi marinkellei TaxID=85056 RepID=K2MZY8_TRYCR|nr:hypothetical protein MOQ_004819 [Trypanosoma cruzi marinkellei]
MMRGKSLSSRFNSSGKHYFYHLMDIVEASKELQALKDAASAANKTSGAECPVTNAGVNESLNSMSVGEGGKAMPPTTSTDGSVPNSNQINQTPPVGGNTIQRSGNPLHNGAKPSGMPGIISSAASPQEDDLVSSSSTGRARKATNNRDDCEEENNGRSSASVGVNMPFIIGVPRHLEQKEGSFIIPQAQRFGGAPLVNRRRRGKQRGADTTFWSRCLEWGFSNFSGSPLRVAVTLGVVLLGTIVFLLLIRLLLGVVVVDRWYEPLPEETVTRVTRGLEQLRQWHTEMHGLSMGKSAHRGGTSATVMLMSMRSPPPVRVTLKDMTAVVKELLARYVAVQQEMIAIRLQRMRRELADAETIFDGRSRLVDGFSLDSLLRDEENEENMHINNDGDAIWDNNAAFSQEKGYPQSASRLSTAHIKADLNRLVHYVREAIAMVKWIFSRRSSSDNHHNQITSPFLRWRGRKMSSGDSSIYRETGEKQKLKRYTEVLANGQLVTQDVTPEDWYERRNCLRLTRELLHLSKLIEGILMEYQDVVMGPLYESYLHQTFSKFAGMNKMSTSVGAAITEVSVGDEHEENGLLSGQNGYILRSVLLRRQTLALLQFDPLIQPGGNRQHEAIRRPRKPRFFSNSESNSGENDNQASSMMTPTRERVKAILRDFVTSTSDSFNGYDSTSVENVGLLMRNILGEVKYWYEHEEEWQTIILWRLNSSSQNQSATQTSLNTTNEEKFKQQGNNDSFHKAIDILPLFRGLWCFLEQPVRLTPEHEEIKEDTATLASDSVASQTPSNRDEVPEAVDSQREELEGKKEIAKKSVAGNDKDNSVDGELSTVEESVTPAKSMNVQLSSDEFLDTDVVEKPSGEEETSMKEGMETAEEEVEEETDAGLRAVELISEEAQIRWLNAFDLFIRSHEDFREQRSEDGREWDWENSHEQEMDEDNDESNAAYFRQRFIRLIGWVKHHYGKYLSNGAITSFGTSGTLSEFMRECSAPQKWWLWWTFLWPPSWFFEGTSVRPMSCWISRLAALDPAVRQIHKDMLRVPLGEVEDLPLMLLYTLSTPSELLKVQYKVHTFSCFLSWLLVLGVAATIAMAFFFC